MRKLFVFPRSFAAVPQATGCVRAVVFGAGLALFCAVTYATTVFATTPAVSSATRLGDTPFARAVAGDLHDDAGLLQFYIDRDFAPLWTDTASASRLAAFFAVADKAHQHGLPTARYDVAGMQALAQTARTMGDIGKLEVAITRAYLAYARDVSSGVIDPNALDIGILRQTDRPDPLAVLADFLAAKDPENFLHNLAPKTPVYARLMLEKIKLEQRIAGGIVENTLDVLPLAPGATGPGVIALRDRLIAAGYLPQTAVAGYDEALRRAVMRFQIERGLTATGVASETTYAALNTTDRDHLASIVIALERLRWMGNLDLSGRYIWVNLPDFTVKILQGDDLVFQTRAVIGKNAPDQQSPEFSDVMEYMVINPSWSVPRSITVKEYLPLLQRNPNAVGHLDVVDRSGQIIPRGAVDFASYSAKSFPFALRQKPSEDNALGLVKFIFPNPYNIYLHDTPSKNLFANDVRAYSHGCIRLGDPVEFAYALLAVQTKDPQGVFQDQLVTGKESSISLDSALPVHLVYFTAWPDAENTITYRHDVYKRDARVLEALVAAGVVLPQ